jgi:hypothetical protein
MAKVTQKDRVLQYLKDEGSITRLQAATELGCFELSSRIGELEAQGIKVKHERITVLNRYGDKCSVAKYTLEE